MEVNDFTRIYMLTYGHNLSISPISITDELINYGLKLIELYKEEKISLTNSNLKEELTNGKSFLKQYCHLHPVTIINDEILRQLDGKTFKNIKDVTNAYNNLGKVVSPFSIPIVMSDKRKTDSIIHTQYPILSEKAFLQKSLVHITHIEMSKQINNITKYLYIHEIIHSQLISSKGIVKDYYNTELLPIFFELFAAVIHFKNKKEYHFLLANRIKSILQELDKLISFSKGNQINSFEQLIQGKYVLSAIKAFKLLFLYLKENDKNRQEILKDINSVLDGKLTLEKYLKEYNITFQNSLNPEIPKKLIKIQ